MNQAAVRTSSDVHSGSSTAASIRSRFQPVSEAAMHGIGKADAGAGEGDERGDPEGAHEDHAVDGLVGGQMLDIAGGVAAESRRRRAGCDRSAATARRRSPARIPAFPSACRWKRDRRADSPCPQARSSSSPISVRKPERALLSRRTMSPSAWSSLTAFRSSISAVCMGMDGGDLRSQSGQHLGAARQKAQHGRIGDRPATSC